MAGKQLARCAVALAADEEYAIPAVVTIYSLLEHAENPESIQLYMLLSSDFPVEYRNKINDLLAQKGAPQARYFDMGSLYEDVNLNIAHTSSATFFRLELPRLLPHEEKCLYLDTDLLVCGDLSELFSMDLGDDYFASVTAAFYCEPQRKLAHEKSIDVPDLINYPNAGVLVMNLEKMRLDHMGDMFEFLKGKNYPMQDQDILYKACYGKIKKLRPAFNALNGYGLTVEEYGAKDSFLPLAYTLEEWREACDKPKIIHFARPEKPWFDYALPFADKWWETAYRAEVGEACFFKYMRRNVEYRNLLLSWREKEKWNFRDRALQADEKVKKLEMQMTECAEEHRSTVAALADLEQSREELATTVDRLNSELDATRNTLEETRNTLEETSDILQAVRQSEAFRIGRIIMFAPCKIKQLFVRVFGSHKD